MAKSKKKSIKSKQRKKRNRKAKDMIREGTVLSTHKVEMKGGPIPNPPDSAKEAIPPPLTKRP